jgi:hypothetical protein
VKSESFLSLHAEFTLHAKELHAPVLTITAMNKRLLVIPLLMVTTGAFSQVTPAGGYTPPDDTPKFNVGVTIFGDFTYQDSPKIQDVDKNNVNLSSFNISRAYINITGNLNHYFAFRITPDIARETGSGASLSGSQEFRLKYAYAQLNLDDWTTHGSWLRGGVQQTPYMDYTEGIYRYRFQGTIFPEREGFLSAADAGFSGHYNLPGNYGDVHAGFYNGENYNKAETNDQKAFQIRGTLRPLPLGGIWKGLRLTGFLVDDHYAKSDKRSRAIGQITFESSPINAGFDYLQTKDRAAKAASQVDGNGWSVWATPKLTRGWELLLRHDDFKPNKSLSGLKRRRNIAGIAYWLQGLTRVTSAILLDYDSLERTGLTPSVPRTTNYEVKMLVNF